MQVFSGHHSTAQPWASAASPLAHACTQAWWRRHCTAIATRCMTPVQFLAPGGLAAAEVCTCSTSSNRSALFVLLCLACFKFYTISRRRCSAHGQSRPNMRCPIKPCAILRKHTNVSRHALRRSVTTMSSSMRCTKICTGPPTTPRCSVRFASKMVFS